MRKLIKNPSNYLTIIYKYTKFCTYVYIITSALFSFKNYLFITNLDLLIIY